MLGFSWLELFVIVTLAPVALFLYIRGVRESRAVTKRDLERLAEIEDVVRLHGTNRQAAEARARLKEQRDEAELATLRRKAPVDSEAAKELLRCLDRRLGSLRAAEREFRSTPDLGQQGAASLAEIQRELRQLESELADTRKRFG